MYQLLDTAVGNDSCLDPSHDRGVTFWTLDCNLLGQAAAYIFHVTLVWERQHPDGTRVVRSRGKGHSLQLRPCAVLLGVTGATRRIVALSSPPPPIAPLAVRYV